MAARSVPLTAKPVFRATTVSRASMLSARSVPNGTHVLNVWKMLISKELVMIRIVSVMMASSTMLLLARACHATSDVRPAPMTLTRVVHLVSLDIISKLTPTPAWSSVLLGSYRTTLRTSAQELQEKYSVLSLVLSRTTGSIRTLVWNLYWVQVKMLESQIRQIHQCTYVEWCSLQGIYRSII